MSSENLPSPLPAESGGYLPDVAYAPNGWPGDQPAEAPSSGLQLGRYIAALGRYKWLILGLTLVGAGVGYGITRFLEPQYTASASLWLGTGNRVNASGPVPADPMQANQNWVGMLTSRRVLANIVARRKLFLRAESVDSSLFDSMEATSDVKRGTYELRTDASGARYTLLRMPAREKGEPKVVESGLVGDSIGRAIGLKWQPQPGQLAASTNLRFSLLPPAVAAGQLLQNLNTRIIQNSSILQVTLTGTDRARLAPTLNQLVEDFVATAADIQSGNTVQTAQQLRRQADSAAVALRAAETALETYRVATITEPTDATPVTPGLQQTMSPVMQDYYAKKAAYDNIRQERQQLEGILRNVRGGNISLLEFGSVTSANNSPDLQQALKDLTAKEAQLRTARINYTDEHPAVKALQADVQRLRTVEIPRATQELVSELRKREGTMQQQIASAEREIRGIPSRSIEEQRLQREVQTRQGVYQVLEDKYQQTRLAAMTAQPTITVLDTAVPPMRPLQDRSIFIMLAGLGGGLALGVLGALLLDQMDPRFRYPEQATSELGLSIIGAVPRLPRGRNGETDPEEAAQIIEAFRTIRMNLRYAFDGAGSIALAVSSPGPGDGKSLVSLNLALSFAEAGYRTLLVDGDIRRGELHEAFGTPIVRRPGLMDYLVGSVPLDSVFRETTHENLTLVPCGTRRHRGPELLQSPSLETFMEAMRTRYDAVIVDTPPLAAGIDPFVLGTATGNLLLVLRTGETDRKLAQSRLELAQRLPIRILGAVLNDIHASGAYRYYSYLYGYSLDEDERALPRPTSEVGADDE
ncbi:MAG TPA: polysaccharide biosynthesis tyrosine autokinase [Gemmatimonadaceae bacterium]|nr:polysaccharide biosynthesis tyrosine autokinase [Gemmatimonadaceae bacterium]